MKFFTGKDNFLRSKQVAGIEYTILPGGDLVIRVVILKENKSKVEIISSAEFNKEEDLKNFIPENIPVILILNGKGIIHKKIVLQQNESDKNVLQNILPNADTKDFYIEKHTSSGSHEDNNLFVSVTRKTLPDDLLNRFKNNGYQVIACSLGPFCIQSIFPLIFNSANGEFIIYNHHFTVHNNIIVDYKDAEVSENNDNINLGGNFLRPSFALAFAAAFQYFLSGEKGFSLQPIVILNSQQEFRQKKIFEKAGWTLLITFLGVLFINFFLFQYYSGKNAGLNSQYARLQNELENYRKIEKDFKDKQEFLKRSGLLETSRTSFYADQVAYESPPAIKLTGLTIFPVIKSTDGGEEKLSFKTKIITVSGQCNLSSELNEWMKVLKNKKWVNKVSLLDYRQDNLKTPGQFIIELEIN